MISFENPDVELVVTEAAYQWGRQTVAIIAYYKDNASPSKGRGVLDGSAANQDAFGACFTTTLPTSEAR